MANFKWPNARDWIGIGTFTLSVMVIWLMKEDAALREDEFFQTIATAIILTGFLGGPVGWAYQATKGGGEAAESSARIAEKAAEAAVGANAGPPPKDVKQAAEQVAGAAEDERDKITKGKPVG